jgi:two-component system cell cycle response regulator
MGTRVLIVEDNAMNRELMDYLLRAFGFETLKAVNGRIGLDVARRERPDLILCDIQMPDVDGLEFARQAKADPALRDMPLVAVTALAMVGDRERVLAHGFDGYISKPLDPQRLIEVVNGLLPEALHRSSAQRTVPAEPAAPSTLVAPVILVVDDSPNNLQLKRDLLQPHGFEVLTALTAGLALALARERRPALIISDVGMREGNGFDFIRAVKADVDLCRIPFFFLSSTHWDEASRRLGLELGATRYLLRPLEPELLLKEIRDCLHL